MGKPFTAVTVLVERLTAEEYPENDFSGIPDLIEAIKLQDSGPTEASRAIRKKLKYGSVHRQLRALTILDALIDNAGKSFQRSFADEPLLERLRIAATDSTTDPDVRKKLRVLFNKWAFEYKDTPGLHSIAALHKQFPQRKPRPEQTPRIDPGKQSPPPAGSPKSPTTPSSASPKPSSAAASSKPAEDNSKSHKKSKSKTKHTPFNLEKEKPQLKEALANASVASTNLTNALKRINREKETSSQNAEAVGQLNGCKQLRKVILRYIQHVESEQWLGSLIHANDELVAAIQLFDAYNKPIEEDSDSDEDWNMVPERPNSTNAEGISERLARMGMEGDDIPPPMPPRPGMSTEKGKDTAEPEEEDDPDNPFGNQYEISGDEREAVTWKAV